MTSTSPTDVRILTRVDKIDAGFQRLLRGEDAVSEHDKHFAIRARAGLPPRLVGLSSRSLPSLDDALDALEGAGGALRIEVGGHVLDAAVADALLERGFRPSGTISVHQGPVPAPEIQTNPEMSAEPVDSDASWREFVEVFQRGFDLPEAERPAAGELAGWRERPGLELFVARLHGTPVAAGFLLLDGPVAYLGSAASTHVLRRQGGHLALLARRLARAAESDATRAFAQAEFGGTAQRNLERAGLRLLGTKTVFSPREG